MNQLDTTGIDYPTLELGGVVFTLKFTRAALLYRLSKKDVRIADINGPPPKNLAAVVDVLHAALFGQFEGTPEQLLELVMAEDKMRAARAAIDAAMGKVFPSPMATPATAAGEAKTPVQ